MRTRPIYKIGAIVLSIVLIACGTGSTTDEATSDKINVLATTPMLGDFVNQIGGENINLTILMPPEADPHTYDPSPQDATKIADADVVFYVGLKYEPSALIKLVENTSNSDSVLVEVGESINPIEFSEEGHDDHKDHDDHDEEGHDDHDEEGHDDHDEEGHDDHDEEGHDDHDEEGHDDHDEEGHDDHDEEGHDDHDEEGHDDHDEEGHDDHDEEGHDDHDEEGHDDHDEEGHDDHDEEGTTIMMKKVTTIDDA